MATQSLQEKIDELRARINLLGESQISSCYSFGNSDCCYLVCNKYMYMYLVLQLLASMTAR